MKTTIALASLLSLAGACSAQTTNPVVIVETSLGNFKIELFEDKAPVTVKNFLTYVDEKFYDGTIFHRVNNEFFQGGGFESGMKEKKTKPPIINESLNGLSNQRGTVAMARNSQPNSATSQFFINVVDNPFLDRAKASDQIGQCVFGKVIEGIETIDKIKVVRTQVKGVHAKVPVEDVVIKSIKKEMK